MEPDAAQLRVPRADGLGTEADEGVPEALPKYN